MKITVIFMILAIVVCAMVQESEQLLYRPLGRNMEVSGGVGIGVHGSFKRVNRGWGYQECPMKFLRNICQSILACGQETTTTYYTTGTDDYNPTMPYTGWNYRTTTTTAQPWGKK